MVVKQASGKPKDGITHSDIWIEGGSLRPSQQPSSLKVRRASDYRSQRMIKYPEVCGYHCLAEFYHAALLEGDPDVEYYVPQPFRLRIRGKSYIPDIYYLRNGIRYVGELKPRAEFPDELRLPLEEFFKRYRMEFAVISNEHVFEREIAAQNWMTIVRHLLSSAVFDTENVEQDVFETILQAGEISFVEIVDPGNRYSSVLQETAIYRMLHAGKIKTDMESQFLGYDSVLRACI